MRTGPLVAVHPIGTGDRAAASGPGPPSIKFHALEEMRWGLGEGLHMCLFPLFHKPPVKPTAVLFVFFMDYTCLFVFKASQIPVKHGKSFSKHIKKPRPSEVSQRCVLLDLLISVLQTFQALVCTGGLAFTSASS